VGILRRLLMMVRHFFPGARIRVRLDGGFAHPELLDFLDAEPGLEYVVAMASNAVLQRKAEQAMKGTRPGKSMVDGSGPRGIGYFAILAA
jgi:hypothetical protein